MPQRPTPAGGHRLHELLAADEADLVQMVALRGREHASHDVVARTLVRVDVQFRLRLLGRLGAEILVELVDVRYDRAIPEDRVVEIDDEVDYFRLAGLVRRRLRLRPV